MHASVDFIYTSLGNTLYGRKYADTWLRPYVLGEHLIPGVFPVIIFQEDFLLDFGLCVWGFFILLRSLQYKTPVQAELLFIPKVFSVLRPGLGAGVQTWHTMSSLSRWNSFGTLLHLFHQGSRGPGPSWCLIMNRSFVQPKNGSRPG